MCVATEASPRDEVSSTLRGGLTIRQRDEDDATFAPLSGGYEA